MDITVSEGNEFMVSCDGAHSFIYACGLDLGEGIAIDAFPFYHYIEIREKDGCLRIFCLDKESAEEGFDFGEWEEAKVVYSTVNDQ